MQIKVIVTGTTGMVGEGVLLECLANAEVKEALSVVRRPSGLSHPKLKELVVPDFLKLENVKDKLTGYDACFYCAGITSLGINEEDYTKITFDITLHFAQTVLSVNRNMVFIYVSGSLTDSTEKGRLMWARVKGKTENALINLPFRSVYNFRPGLMTATPGQQKLKTVYKIAGIFFPLLALLFPKSVLSLKQVGKAMINSVTKGFQKPILEISDIRALAER